MLKQKSFELILRIVLGLIVLIGIIQIFSFLTGQFEAMNQATEQGVASQQISKYFWQQVMPQLLSYVMSMVAFIGILLSIDVINKKIDYMTNQKISTQKHLSYDSLKQENDDDSLFDDFEIVENKNK